MLQKTSDWLKIHRLGIIVALFALVVSFFIGKELESVYDHNRSAVDCVLPEPPLLIWSKISSALLDCFQWISILKHLVAQISHGAHSTPQPRTVDA